MSKTKRGPFLPDIRPIIAAGIDPKTGLPYKMGGDCGSATKTSVKELLRIIDEQDHVNRFQWFNLPCNISGQELERMLYFKGQLCFFYLEANDEFYFMPYALDGTIDFYGRFNRIHPIPFAYGVDDGQKKITQQQRDLLSTIRLTVRYGVVDEDDVDINMLTKSAVVLKDRTTQLSETVRPRWNVIDEILDLEAEFIPYMRTALINSTGIVGLRVQDADQSDNATVASRLVKTSALSGETYTPIVGTMEFQELTNGSVSQATEFLLAMQSTDNLRLKSLGLANGGLFEKQAHELQSENNMNASNADTILMDALSRRQHFCNIVNSIWGLSIWCELSEAVIGQDTNGDGVSYDTDQDASRTGVEGGIDDVD